MYHQPCPDALLCWDISLILFPLSYETQQQFDYNLSNNHWLIVTFHFLKSCVSINVTLLVVQNLKNVHWKIWYLLLISAGERHHHESYGNKDINDTIQAGNPQQLAPITASQEHIKSKTRTDWIDARQHGIYLFNRVQLNDISTNDYTYKSLIPEVCRDAR